MDERFTIGLEIELHKELHTGGFSWYRLHIWNSKSKTISKKAKLGAKLDHETIFQNEYVLGTLECWGSMPELGQAKLELVTPDTCATDRDKAVKSRVEMYKVAGRLLEFTAMPFKSQKVGADFLRTSVSADCRGQPKEYERSVEGFVEYYNDRLEPVPGAAPLKYKSPDKHMSFLFEPVEHEGQEDRGPLKPVLYSQMTISMPLEAVTSLFDAKLGQWDKNRYSTDGLVNYLFASSLGIACRCSEEITSALAKSADANQWMEEVEERFEPKRKEGLPKFVSPKSQLDKTLRGYWERGLAAAPKSMETGGKTSQASPSSGHTDHAAEELTLELLKLKINKPFAAQRKLRKVHGFFSLVAYVIIVYVLFKNFRVGGRKDQFVFLPKTRLNDLWRQGLSLSDKAALGVLSPSWTRDMHIVAEIKAIVRKQLKLMGTTLDRHSRMNKSSEADWVQFTQLVDSAVDDASVQEYLESIFVTNSASIYEKKAIRLLDGFRMLHSDQVDTVRSLGGLEKVVLEYRRAGDYKSEADLIQGIEEKTNDLKTLHDAVYAKFQRPSK